VGFFPLSRISRIWRLIPLPLSSACGLPFVQLDANDQVGLGGEKLMQGEPEVLRKARA
jgi:hypothetical protein